MRFKRSSGLTASEKLLADLCDNSFLSLWSYPNLFRKPGKELCDLMVVLGNDVAIFSDKSCGYPNTGDTELDWRRWHRRSIVDSAKQLAQAKRWLINCPDRVFLDSGCSEKFPYPLPSSMNIHLICIALGALERAKSETGKANLKISTLDQDDGKKFTITKADAVGGWLHVFDESNLPILLRELSTASDFFDYLKKKEQLFDSKKFAYAESELDLMAYFIWNGREFPAPAAMFKLDPDLWPKVETNDQFLAGRSENKVSFFWDGLIEYLNKHFLEESLDGGNDIPVADYERAVRIMASEGRFYRRVLSKWILERAEKAKEGYVGSILESTQPHTHYVLLIGPGSAKEKYAEYRADRVMKLKARCLASKAARPATKFIVGIALDARGVKGSSEDFIFLDTGDWSEEQIASAEKIRQELGYFVDGKMLTTKLSENEYPQKP
jgi:hypothetical protein